MGTAMVKVSRMALLLLIARLFTFRLFCETASIQPKTPTQTVYTDEFVCVYAILILHAEENRLQSVITDWLTIRRIHG